LLIQGFTSAVTNLRAFVPAVYDVTVAVPKGSPAPTMKRLFSGQPSLVMNIIMIYLPFSENDYFHAMCIREAELQIKLFLPHDYREDVQYNEMNENV
jgi:hypothetical protein